MGLDGSIARSGVFSILSPYMNSSWLSVLMIAVAISCKLIPRSFVFREWNFHFPNLCLYTFLSIDCHRNQKPSKQQKQYRHYTNNNSTNNDDCIDDIDDNRDDIDDDAVDGHDTKSYRCCGSCV